MVRILVAVLFLCATAPLHAGESWADYLKDLADYWTGVPPAPGSRREGKILDKIHQNLQRKTTALDGARTELSYLRSVFAQHLRNLLPLLTPNMYSSFPRKFLPATLHVQQWLVQLRGTRDSAAAILRCFWDPERGMVWLNQAQALLDQQYRLVTRMGGHWETIELNFAALNKNFPGSFQTDLPRLRAVQGESYSVLENHIPFSFLVLPEEGNRKVNLPQGLRLRRRPLPTGDLVNTLPAAKVVHVAHAALGTFCSGTLRLVGLGGRRVSDGVVGFVEKQ